jgi:cupin 2 domain-containing protein
MKGCLLNHIPRHLPEELFETLFSNKHVRIERIISRGHSSPNDFWYDQDQNEFVLVVQGSAGLRIEGRNDDIILRPGEYLNIPAHVRHRVNWTEPNTDTVWLAVHY